MEIPFLIESRTQRDITTQHVKRLRGAAQITMRGKWAKSNKNFGRCLRDKNHLTINGICQQCGYSSVCAWCGRTKQGDGSYEMIAQEINNHTSHGMCKECRRRIKKELGLPFN